MEIEKFEELIEDVLKNIPEKFKNKLENLSIEIDQDNILPSEVINKKPENKIILALYHGVPLTKRSQGKPLFPDKITIYKKALESISNSEQELIKNTKKAVLHELGHYFGLNEKTLKELGY